MAEALRLKTLKSNERAPLCPAGHLPHEGGERCAAIVAVTAGVRYGAATAAKG
jgi:hypothetical protein